MICVFDVVEGPAQGRRFWLRDNQQIEIGRISTADFSVPSDLHMSRHHVIIEASNNAFRVRDAGSSNGTFVNNARIARMELCDGDLIRAGSTTIEVSFVDDDENPHAADGTFSNQPVIGSDTPAASAAPIRTIASENIPLNDDVTRRFRTLKQLLGDSKYAPTDGKPLSHRQVQWANFFEATSSPNLWIQSARAGTKDMSDLLSKVTQQFTINLIINVTQLNRFSRQMLEDWQQENRVTPLSTTLCMVTVQEDDEEYWSFVRSALRQDALICVASDGPLHLDWINGAIEMLSYPSMLYGLLQSDEGNFADRLLQNVEFMMFEQNRFGKLCLLQAQTSQKST